MIPKQLRNRLKFVQGTPLKNRASITEFSRKKTNTAITLEEDDYSENFETFFDYEEDLSGLKPAAEQYSEMVESGNPFVIMEEDEIYNEPVSGFIEMEEAHKDKEKYTEVSGFNFVRCKHIKNNNEQCKRQAPKNGEYCSSHRKLH